MNFAAAVDDDFAAIARYTLERFGHAQLERYRGRIEEGLATLRLFPNIGFAHRELPAGYQAYRVAHHWVCYEIVDEVIEVKGIVRDVSDLDDR